MPWRSAARTLFVSYQSLLRAQLDKDSRARTSSSHVAQAAQPSSVSSEEKGYSQECEGGEDSDATRNCLDRKLCAGCERSSTHSGDCDVLAFIAVRREFSALITPPPPQTNQSHDDGAPAYAVLEGEGVLTCASSCWVGVLPRGEVGTNDLAQCKCTHHGIADGDDGATASVGEAVPGCVQLRLMTSSCRCDGGGVCPGAENGGKDSLPVSGNDTNTLNGM